MTTQTLFTSWPPYSSWEYPGQSGIVAYFSMEIAITPAMPTYSGGLGVLAGDTLRAAADMGLPLVAVTLAHRKGYVKQRLDANGVQSEEDQPWDLEAMLTPEEPVVTVLIEGRTVAIRAWRYDMEGVTGHTIPIYLLDTDLEQNDPRDRELTDHLIRWGRRLSVAAGDGAGHWRRAHPGGALLPAAGLPPERGARVAADDRIVGAAIAG